MELHQNSVRSVAILQMELNSVEIAERSCAKEVVSITIFNR